MLSFYKAPMKIMKEITKIQSIFIWNSSDQRKSINCVNWKKMCSSKENEGLGIKNIELFNILLLLKWMWRIIHDKEVVWYGLLKNRYRNVELGLLNGVGRIGSRKDYIWWPEFVSFCRPCGKDVDPFVANSVFVLGSDLNISFWNIIWRGSQILKEVFLELFPITNSSNTNIAEASSW